MKIVPLQSKIKKFYVELHTFINNDRVMFIYNYDKELFIKCREIWNKITELIGINNAFLNVLYGAYNPLAQHFHIQNRFF